MKCETGTDPKTTTWANGDTQSSTHIKEGGYLSFVLKGFLIPYYLVPDMPAIDINRFLLMALLILIPVCTCIAGFSEVGFGYQFFDWSQQNISMVPNLCIAFASMICIAYFFDLEYWQKSNCGLCFRNTWLVLTFLILVALILFSVDKFEYSSLLLFVTFLPIYLLLIKRVSYPDEKPRDYVASVSGPMFFVSVIIGVSFGIFEGVSVQWNAATLVEYATKAGCEPDFSFHVQCRDSIDSSKTCFSHNSNNTVSFSGDNCTKTCLAVYDGCHHPFVMWAWPFMCSATLFFLSFFCVFFQSGIKKDRLEDLLPMAFFKTWSVLFFMLWIVASISGAAYMQGLTSFVMCLFIAVGILAGITFIHPKYRRKLAKQVEEKLGANMDTFRSLVIVTCLPIFILYFLVSFLNQRVRRMRSMVRQLLFKNDENLNANNPLCSHRPSLASAMDWNGWLTEIASTQIQGMKSWDISKLFVWAIYWGMAFHLMFVLVAQFSIVFLSWVIYKTEEFNLWLLTFCLASVGIAMFLLPPVPGAPIYLMSGIAMVPVAAKELGGIPAAFIYTCVISILIKLAACFLQQKVIGENLSHYVKIRQAVKINSDFMRAAKLLLAEPGISAAKVSVSFFVVVIIFCGFVSHFFKYSRQRFCEFFVHTMMKQNPLVLNVVFYIVILKPRCGGPDWPTSVSCGIMRLDLLPIMLGTLPVVTYLVPLVLSGTFMYLDGIMDTESKEYPWANFMVSFCMILSALVQYALLIYAASHIEQTMRERKDEIDAIPIDQEVKNADDDDIEMINLSLEVSKWEQLPAWVKMCLVLSLLTMTISCYIVYFFGDKCFMEYTLTYTIEENLGGSVWNLLKWPLGWAALIMCVLSSLLLLVFSCWAKKGAVKKMNYNHSGGNLG